ncbi:hypothetical protein GCM10028796_04770 [Ramlibacter monticola]|uniref:Metallophosphoesterase n=1 Tax=Ramlibacter monticola TaxID=1926872 RepID=A0A936Z011_9BURK|nr:metallophosphoesterase [Ramlibacter monticola]MBL0391241.1 metallophosphoesterase [Ramlibacter monticola]
MPESQIYDFNEEDAEDRWIRDAKGVIADTRQRRGIWYSAVLAIVALAGMQIVAKSVVGDALLLVAAVALYPFLYRGDVQAEGNSTGWIRRYGSLLRRAADQLVWQRFLSFCCVPSAFALVWFGPKRRYLPLQVPVTAFAATFVALLCLDMLSTDTVVGLPLVGPQLSELSHTLSVGPFLSRWLMGVDALASRVLWGIVGIVTLLLLHLVILTFAACLGAVAATLVASPFARRIEHEGGADPGCDHASDLHFTKAGEAPIEASSITNAQLGEKLRSAAGAEARALVISGDITDSGGREEWLSFFHALESDECMRGVPIILAPGNHDLFPYMRSYVPRFASIPLSSAVVRLRKIRFLAAVLRVCPEMHVLANGREKSLRDHLHAHVHMIQKCAEDGNEDLNALDELWDACFPMHCVVGVHAYVCLDTNRPTSNVTTSAFGHLARAQANRLELLLTRLRGRPGLTVVIVGHHHMFTPFTSRLRGWRIKHLEIVSGRHAFRSASCSADYYLHGHRHLPFGFRINRLRVISAASLRFPEQTSK